MLPDRSLLVGQKLLENAKIEKFKCDILGNFQTLCYRVTFDMLMNWGFKTCIFDLIMINFYLQVTKERLQLERHLQIANDSLQRNNGVDLQKYISLEQSNNYLRQQLDSLDLLQQEHKLVEIQYREKEEACR